MPVGDGDIQIGGALIKGTKVRLVQPQEADPYLEARLTLVWRVHSVVDMADLAEMQETGEVIVNLRNVQGVMHGVRDVGGGQA